MEKTLTCVFFPDLLPWEREGLMPLVQSLGQWGKIETIDFDPDENQVPRGQAARGPFWIFAHRWERALAALRLPPGTQVFVSILSPPRPAAFFTALFWQRFRPMSEGVRLVTHSPLSFRFLCEINKIPSEQVFHLPLPIGPVDARKVHVAPSHSQVSPSPFTLVSVPPNRTTRPREASNAIPWL